MFLKKKIKLLVCEYFDCGMYFNNSIVFTYKKDNCRITQCSLFNYEFSINGNSIYIGNYFGICGFLKSFKQYYKIINSFELKDPQIINLELKDINEEDYKSQIKGLNKKVGELNHKLKESLNKIDCYKKEIQNLNVAIKEKSDKITDQNLEICQLTLDCKEAADLIETIYYNNEEINYGTKRYKLDHFPKDVQEFIKDLIKEYYNK